jgi:hypothetical protein
MCRKSSLAFQKANQFLEMRCREGLGSRRVERDVKEHWAVVLMFVILLVMMD